MKFELPYTNDTIRDMAGKTMVLSENHRSESLFRAFWTFQVKGGGDLDRGYFEVQDGVLRLMDKQGLFCDFAAIETRAGVVFAVGTAAQTVSRHGFDRITMHERVVLPTSDFGICISSHVSYEKSTLPRLLDSIRKAKFDMSKVVAVVGGYKGDKTEEIEGARVVYQEPNGQGFGGLTAVSGNLPYWLLLHDTCEAERSFLECAGDIDIGLGPDVIRLRGDVDDWTGFYKTAFVDRIKAEIAANPDVSADAIKQWARIVTMIPGKVVQTGVKDVYGKGNRRAIQKLPVGIRKYQGVTGRRTP